MSTSKEPDDYVAYRYIEGVESPSGYRYGGYHPLTIGAEIHKRYRVVHKLGHGTYSTIWLARDGKTDDLVAVKVGSADSDRREVDVLSAFANGHHSSAAESGRDLIPAVIDRFEIHGPNGVHPCYVTLPARQSVSGAQDGSYIRLFQLEVVRALAAQLTLAVAFIHSLGYVHGDLHLGNVLLRLPTAYSRLSDEELYVKFGSPRSEPIIRLDEKDLRPGVPSYAILPAWFGQPSEEFTLSESRILLSDFGESWLPSEESRYQSRTPMSIRPPEAKFEPDVSLSFSSDIWTLACAIWSISGQRPLFDGTWAFDDDDITCEHVDALGLLPHEWWEKWDARLEYYTESGQPTGEREVMTWDDRFEDSIQKPRRDEGFAAFDPEESAAFLTMIKSMLAYRPGDRPTIKQVLESEWMVRWGLPTYWQLQQEGRESSEGDV